MAMQQLVFRAIFLFATPGFLFLGLSTTYGDGPNRATPSDRAAGQWIDSLLGPELAPPPQQRSTAERGTRRRATLRAKLVHNPDTSDGTPEFALIDRAGGIVRYVEPVTAIDLEPHVGQLVRVRHDTGNVLLASQLALPAATGIQLAANEEPIPAGEATAESSILTAPPQYDQYDLPTAAGPDMGAPLYLDEGLNFDGCPQCGGVACGPGGCGYGARGVLYAHAEYLLWWLEGMNTPPLVTQIPHDVSDPAAPTVIGPAVTLYGGNRVLEDERHGGRITFGVWLDDYGQWAIEGDYLGLGDLNESFQAGVKDGTFPADGLFIYRPFFNTGILDDEPTTRGRALEEVDTNALDGSVRVDIRSRFQTAGIRLRHNLCCREGCSTCCGAAVGCGAGVGCAGCGTGVGTPLGPFRRLGNLLRQGTRHTDVLYGFRWAGLDESLLAVEDLQEIDDLTPPLTLGDEIDVVDLFATQNDFAGFEIGYETQWHRRRWSLNLLSKLAIGNTRQRVAIDGSTTIDDGAGDVQTSAGGLLTQRYVNPGADDTLGTDDDFVVGNIGVYERDEFSVLPEIGLTLGYDLTQRVKLTVGYTLLYWSNVVRPGDQIGLDVNANLLDRSDPPDADKPDTIVLDDEPRFVFRQTDLWAQGLRLGAECTW